MNNKEKIKILLRLFKEDIISADEFCILVEEDKKYIYYTQDQNIKPNWDYYSNPTNSSIHSNTFIVDNLKNNNTTIGSSFNKTFFDSKRPKFST